MISWIVLSRFAETPWLYKEPFGGEMPKHEINETLFESFSARCECFDWANL